MNTFAKVFRHNNITKIRGSLLGKNFSRYSLSTSPKYSDNKENSYSNAKYLGYGAAGKHHSLDINLLFCF